MFAKVVVDIKSSQLNESFDYHVPKEVEEYVFVGSRVKVSFGMQQVLGFVIELTETSQFSGNLKDILEVYSYEKELNADQVELAKYLSQDLNAPLVQTLDLMTPAFLKENKKKYITVAHFTELHPDVALLFGSKKKINFDKVHESLKMLVQRELKKGTLQMDYEFLTYGKQKKVKQYSLDGDLKVNSRPRQLVVEYLRLRGSVSESELIQATSVSRALLGKMVADNTLRLEYVTVLEETRGDVINSSRYPFSYDQRQLLEKYEESKGKPLLLFTKDDAFKNAFLFEVVATSLKNQNKVVVFAPTIMACERMRGILERNFKNLSVLTYHSKNTQSENYDTYMNVKHGNFDCLVATPAAAFFPFDKGGTFVVLDEESSHYVYENYPHYDVTKVFEKRREFLDCKLLFVSSSPSIYSYYMQRHNKYYLLEDSTDLRHQVTVVDMKEEILEENNIVLSSALIAKIREAMAERKISMLIVNNKAFSTMIRCRECGHVSTCPKCKIPLVYLASKKIAKCSYCEHKEEHFHICSKCNSKNVLSMGFGLEQVRQKVLMAFPTARLMQVDSDHMTDLEDYTELLSAIEENTVDIIIGTNVLIDSIKDQVKVVGLLYVDSYLNVSDHRASEATFHLISKMTSFEELVVQTYYKDHYAIKNATKSDYEAFYQKEIATRELMQYEPFTEMNVIEVTGPYDKLFHFGYYYRKAIRRIIGEGNFLGPSYDYKLRGVKIVLKHNHHNEVVRILNDAVRNFNERELQVRFVRYPKGM